MFFFNVVQVVPAPDNDFIINSASADDKGNAPLRESAR